MTFVYTEVSKNKRNSWLLVFSFIALIAAMGALAGVQSNGEPLPFGILFGCGAILYALFAYFIGSKATLAMGSAQATTKEQHPELHRLVENLAITAGLPKPAIYVIEDAGMNAFATGRDPEHAAVAVTTGLLKNLNKNELQGVLAHEVAHIANYDVRITMLVTMLVGLIAVLADIFIRVAFRGTGRNKGKGGIALLIIGLIFIILSPIVANLIQLALSRRRESLADATAVLFTRYAEGLASALEKIGRSTTPLRTANHGMAHLYIANPFKKKLKTLFSTHPPIEERVQKLRSMM